MAMHGGVSSNYAVLEGWPKWQEIGWAYLPALWFSRCLNKEIFVRWCWAFDQQTLVGNLVDLVFKKAPNGGPAYQWFFEALKKGVLGDGIENIKNNKLFDGYNKVDPITNFHFLL